VRDGHVSEVVSRFIPTPVGNGRAQRDRHSARSVHPHARGERSRLVADVVELDGSSPRPWGTARRCRGRWGQGRFIPTPVGNGGIKSTRVGGPSVHPHARGERQDFYGEKHRLIGSSPRPWGTVLLFSAHSLSFRFIPTPVGNGATRSGRASLPSVHPHARGERARVLATILRQPGSSPRPWGTANYHPLGDAS